METAALRPLEESDIPLLARWLSDEMVLEYYEGRNNPFDEQAVREKFLGADPPGMQRWILMELSQPVGYLQTYPLSREECREELDWVPKTGSVYAMDLFIGLAAKWNQGLGRRFVTLARDYLTGVLGAAWVVLDPRTENIRAIRCYEHCGFERRKLLPRHELHEGALRDCWLMAYQARKSK